MRSNLKLKWIRGLFIIPLLAIFPVVGLSQDIPLGYSTLNFPKVFIEKFENANKTTKFAGVADSIKAMITTQLGKAFLQLTSNASDADFILKGSASILPGARYFLKNQPRITRPAFRQFQSVSNFSATRSKTDAEINNPKLYVDLNLLDTTLGFYVWGNSFTIDNITEEIRGKIDISTKSILDKIFANYSGTIEISNAEGLTLFIRREKIVNKSGKTRNSNIADFGRFEQKPYMQGKYIIEARRVGFEPFKKNIRVIPSRKSIFRIPPGAFKKSVSNFVISGVNPGSRITLTGRSDHHISAYELGEDLIQKYSGGFGENKLFRSGVSRNMFRRLARKKYLDNSFASDLQKILDVELNSRRRGFDPLTLIREFDQFILSGVKQDIIKQSSKYFSGEIIINDDSTVKNISGKIKATYDKNNKSVTITDLHVGQYDLKVLNLKQSGSRIYIIGPQVFDQIEVVKNVSDQKGESANQYKIIEDLTENKKLGRVLIFVNKNPSSNLIFHWDNSFNVTLENKTWQIVVDKIEKRTYEFIITENDNRNLKFGQAKFGKNNDKVIFIGKIPRFTFSTRTINNPRLPDNLRRNLLRARRSAFNQGF